MEGVRQLRAAPLITFSISLRVGVRGQGQGPRVATQVESHTSSSCSTQTTWSLLELHPIFVLLLLLLSSKASSKASSRASSRARGISTLAHPSRVLHLSGISGNRVQPLSPPPTHLSVLSSQASSLMGHMIAWRI